jgi:hypothetical protein
VISVRFELIAKNPEEKREAWWTVFMTRLDTRLRSTTSDSPEDGQSSCKKMLMIEMLEGRSLWGETGVLSGAGR